MSTSNAGDNMLPKILTILMLLLILTSLFTALYQLMKKRPDQQSNVAKALTVRISLSICLFVLLLTGFHFGWISPAGMR
jgi:TRAP-type C4-dicarboxylate transport system permease large subunit